MAKGYFKLEPDLLIETAQSHGYWILNGNGLMMQIAIKNMVSAKVTSIRCWLMGNSIWMDKETRSLS